ncbi:putative (di)nucleoside polyphosphate hydrolase [Alphaproteobacteria bacterium]
MNYKVSWYLDKRIRLITKIVRKEGLKEALLYLEQKSVTSDRMMHFMLRSIDNMVAHNLIPNTKLATGYYRPGVGAMIFNKKQEILVGQRKNTPMAAWQMPQGGIDAGENPKQAVYREVYEEVGIDKVAIIYESKHWYSYNFPEGVLNSIYKGQYKGQRQKWFLLAFLGSDSDIKIDRDPEIQEFAKWRWVNIAALCKTAIYFKKKLYAKIVREFKSTLLEYTSNNTTT